MSSHAIINTIKLARQITISKVESIDEELFNVQPPQFNNTVAWNVGHLIGVADSILFQRIAQTATKLPEGFTAMFKGGTKPSDWTTSPPSKAEFVDLLKKQLSDVVETFTDKVEDRLPDPIKIRDFHLETVGDAIGFVIFHEGQHAAVVSDMAKVIQYQK